MTLLTWTLYDEPLYIHLQCSVAMDRTYHTLVDCPIYIYIIQIVSAPTRFVFLDVSGLYIRCYLEWDVNMYQRLSVESFGPWLMLREFSSYVRYYWLFLYWMVRVLSAITNNSQEVVFVMAIIVIVIIELLFCSTHILGSHTSTPPPHSLRVYSFDYMRLNSEVSNFLHRVTLHSGVLDFLWSVFPRLS